MKTNSLVTVLITCYNREKTIERAVESVLAQTYKNLDIVIVDDGSKDNSIKILKDYEKNERIRVVYHEQNKGVNGAKNTGLDNIKGEWFTFVDSDDEILPEAIETLMQVPQLVGDDKIDAVSCNVIDYNSKQWHGEGVDGDQYLDYSKIMQSTSGDFWGITKTSLLNGDRFVNNVIGYEGLLWHKINKRANRYYIHKALLIYHTENADRISLKMTKKDLEYRVRLYKHLITEQEYLKDISSLKEKRFLNICIQGIFYMTYDYNRSIAKDYLKMLSQIKGIKKRKIIAYMVYLIRNPFNRALIPFLAK